MESSLKDRVVLVTGAGRGIGRAHAGLLAERGAAVVVNDLGTTVNGDGADVRIADQAAAEITALGGRAVGDTRDISTFAGAAKVVQHVVDTFGRIDVVVNNAGIIGGGPLATIDEEQLLKLMAVHFIGTVGIVKAAAPFMIAQGWGRVINTVSEAAFPVRSETGGGLAYGPAKAAVWSVTLSLANELGPYNITVNGISPGALSRMNEERLMAQGLPPGLDLDPLHVARVAAWLASEDAGDVNGKVIHVASGQHREYRITRSGDTELARRVALAVEAADATG